MSKIVKSLLILFIIFSISIFINFSYAIDLNLTETINNTNSSYINNNEYEENEVENNMSNLFTSNTISHSFEEDTTTSTRVSTVENLPESNLGLSNILNILLITVGIILIFLGIAILIKLTK